MSELLIKLNNNENISRQIAEGIFEESANYLIILLSVFLFLVAIVAAYFLSRKTYAPIAQIARKLNVNNLRAPLAEIESNIDSIIGENKKLTQMLSDYTPHLKQIFLQDLLFGRITDTKTIESKLSYYNIALSPCDCFMSYSIRINTISESTAHEQQGNTLTDYITKLIQDKLLHIYPGFILQTGNYEYTLIISFKNDKSKSDISSLAYSLSSEIHKAIAEELNYSFAIGVSNLHTGIPNMPTAYNESKFALYSNSVVSHNNTTLYCNVSNSESNSIEFPLLIEQKSASENNNKYNRNQPILETIKNYIHENLHKDLSIDALSEKFFVSSSYLRKLFKDVNSITLKNYIDNERIQRAKELLCNPNIKISDIPHKIGYLSPQSFTRAFKQHTGKTPGEYRNEHIK